MLVVGLTKFKYLTWVYFFSLQATLFINSTFGIQIISLKKDSKYPWTEKEVALTTWTPSIPSIHLGFVLISRNNGRVYLA